MVLFFQLTAFIIFQIQDISPLQMAPAGILGPDLVYPWGAKRALGSREESRCLFKVNSEMAGPNGLKLLGGMIEGMWENVLIRVRG